MALLLHRKNRVQSLRQTKPIQLLKKTRTTNTLVDRDSVDGHNPYILLQEASGANLRPGSHLSCASAWSSELPMRSDTGGCPSLSLFLTTKVPRGGIMEDGKVMECENRMESWAPIKCWTPVEMQARVGPSSALDTYGVGPDNVTPGDCCTRMEYLSPRDCPASRGYSIRRQCSTPNSDWKSEQPFLRTDNVNNYKLSSKPFGTPTLFQSEKSQNFVKDDDTECTIGSRILQFAGPRTQNIVREGNVSFLPEKDKHDERIASAGFW